MLKFLSTIQKSKITYTGSGEIIDAQILVKLSWFCKSVEVGLAKYVLFQIICKTSVSQMLSLKMLIFLPLFGRDISSFTRK